MSKKSIKDIFKPVNQENTIENNITLIKPNIFILKVDKMTMQIITDADEETILEIFKKSSANTFEEKSFDEILREKGYFCNVKQIKDGQSLFGSLF